MGRSGHQGNVLECAPYGKSSIVTESGRVALLGCLQPLAEHRNLWRQKAQVLWILEPKDEDIFKR